MKRRYFFFTAAAAATAGLSGCKGRVRGTGKPVVRFGHFPNITHVQGLVAHNLSRHGKGWFEQRLGMEVQWYTYNAGPSATEAIFARSLDVTYIGPSPTLNAYAKSKGKEMRILAGAANGGTALIVRPEAGIQTAADFRGKTVATPQLGNTQDVQARAWLLEQGLNVTLTGGDVAILPTQSADQLGLFQKGDLDAVWAAEPWAARLEVEANGKVFLEDKETNVTLLAASAAFVREQRDLAAKLVAAHKELTIWIQEHAAEAREHIKDELKALTTATPGDAVLDRALARTLITNDISRASLEKMVGQAQKVGFLKGIPDLTELLPTL